MSVDPNLAGFLMDKLGVGAGGAPTPASPFTPSGSPSIPGFGGGKNTAGFMGGEALGALPTNVSAHDILNNLDREFVQRYVMKLEEAKLMLKAYMGELESLTNRLSKADAGIRMVLGETEIEAKKAIIAETVSKLTAHQKRTYERFNK